MYNHKIISVIIIFCLFFIASVTAARAGMEEVEYDFIANMSCSKIGPQHPKHTEATGQVLFKLDEERQELSYILKVVNIEDAYMAHLHVGPCGEEPQEKEGVPRDQGPIAAWLYLCKEKDGCTDEGKFTGVLAQGVITPDDLQNNVTFPELIKAMRTGHAYTNVHTKKYITCEICGEVICEICGDVDSK
ncbi:MAG: CHRD domain-containing protein [Desulfobulbales bacterium]